MPVMIDYITPQFSYPFMALVCREGDCCLEVLGNCSRLILLETLRTGCEMDSGCTSFARVFDH
jgi:hypothetical protein